MKIRLILSAILALTPLILSPAAIAQPLAEQPDTDLEAASATTSRELPGFALQISLEKTSFEVGEPIAVTFDYRNEGDTPVTMTRSGTSYSPMRVVKREFRVRQIDGDMFFQSKTSPFGMISEMVGTETIKPGESSREVVILNERIFLEHPGHYELTAWSSAISFNNKTRWLQSAPIKLQIVPATETYRAQVLNEAEAQINAARAVASGRLLTSYPHALEIASNAARKLGWLQDERAIPILIAALEVGNHYQFDAESALRSYPRTPVKAALRQRLEDGNPITTSRNLWLELSTDSPDERKALETELDRRLRVALESETNPQKRHYLATRGLGDSPALRSDPKFWHEALTNPEVGGGTISYEIHSLLSAASQEQKTRVDEYPIQTTDLKTALETHSPYQAPMLIFHALEGRDPFYLRQFLLARVDNQTFPYPRGAFHVFSDTQLQHVAAKLIAAIKSPELGNDNAKRDDRGRRLRDMALRGVTIEQLEETEKWLLQNAPDADPPILDAIELKMPGRTWFWLQQSLAKRPLKSPYDNRMRALVLQKNPAARQIVRGLLQGDSEQRRLEVLRAITSAAAPPFMEDSRSRWSSGDQVLPRATNSTFDDLEKDLAKLTTSGSADVKQAAIQAYNAVISLNKNTGSGK